VFQLSRCRSARHNPRAYFRDKRLTRQDYLDARIPVDCRLGAENGGCDVVRWALAFERVGAAHHRAAESTLERHAGHARASGQLYDPETQLLFAQAWEPVEAGRAGYPLGRLRTGAIRHAESLGAGSGERLRSWWRVALHWEILRVGVHFARISE